MPSARRRNGSSFGVELGRLLAARDMTYRDLSRLTGLGPRTLHRYALGLRRASDETLELIAAAFELEPQELLEWRRRRVLERVGESAQLVDALWRRL